MALGSTKYNKALRDLWKRRRKNSSDMSDITDVLRIDEKTEQIRLDGKRKRGLRDTFSTIRGV